MFFFSFLILLSFYFIFWSAVYFYVFRFFPFFSYSLLPFLFTLFFFIVGLFFFIVGLFFQMVVGYWLFPPLEVLQAAVDNVQIEIILMSRLGGRPCIGVDDWP